MIKLQSSLPQASLDFNTTLKAQTQQCVKAFQNRPQLGFRADQAVGLLPPKDLS